ncbi:hypothetical protein HPC49_06385 [Pyxidicoccus fallax]|uniref:DUF7151 domain-containing protein n=1 Tax=Pyxidicoccus fallax TaxID=394095 RepID=A0A848LCC3_9BACT|nr:hypothetical protein [Pyxidicoccus fallax]NMO14465.1 hypothetical protein [Pyxidicoccus fallax]NPC77881.1 hypothetical protein [Pyxidicoccus fallax]
MKHGFMRWTWGAVLALASGCDGIELERLVKQQEPLSISRDEAPGGNCVLGGSEVLTGLDADEDGQLDDAEVRRTFYICDTDLPDVLLLNEKVLPGEKCPRGGQVSRAGQDTNGNGALDAAEVTREVYSCEEASPVVVRFTPTSDESCFPSATRVEAGLDLDRDGVLDDAERTAATLACLDSGQVKYRLQPQPESAHCGTGSTRVDVGLDTDGDGTLEDPEVSSTAFVCQPLRTFDGTYEVHSAADLAVLRGIGRVRGDVRISTTPLTEVELPALLMVEGEIFVQGNTALTRLEMTGLRLVERDVVIDGNGNLTTLLLGSRVSPGPALWIEGDLRVENNLWLPTLFGLRNAQPRRDVVIRNNDALETAGSFDNIRQHPGSIIVADNVSLQHLPFPNLNHVRGDVRITANTALPSLGLPALLGISGDLEVAGNSSLLDLSGMPELTTINGGLLVVENEHLRSTKGMETLSSLGTFLLARNPDLETVTGFPSLRTLDSLSIGENARLQALGPLHLWSVDSLYIHHNPLLTDLSGLGNLQSVRALGVNTNPSLTSLRDLGHLRSLEQLLVADNAKLTTLQLDGLEQVSAYFIIENNPRLPTCLATGLATRVYTGTEEPARTSGNDSTASCPPPPLPDGWNPLLPGGFE